jgi:putative NIF3 family GTP cyclohydrolase 1 type 2
MSLASKAFALGADIFISGDLKFHQAQEIESLGLTLDVGHFALEEVMVAVWADELTTALAGEVRVLFIPGRDPFQINSLTNAES